MTRDLYKAGPKALEVTSGAFLFPAPLGAATEPPDPFAADLLAEGSAASRMAARC
jgi:hypothetical protein